MKVKLFAILLVLGLVRSAFGAGGAVGGGSRDVEVAENDLVTNEDEDGVKYFRVERPLLLQCNTTSVPPNQVMSLEWRHNDVVLQPDDRIKIDAKNYTLNITQSKGSDYGTYKCTMIKKETNEKVFEREFEVMTLPYYKRMPTSSTVLEGDTLTLDCGASGFPAPNVVWTKDGVNVKDVVNASRIEFFPNTGQETMLTNDSVLVIKHVVKEDRGIFMCAVNNAGSRRYNTTTNVRVKDIYSALWPFLGIVVEVVVLCLIIFIYEKRRVKAEFDESDTDQGPEEKNTVDSKDADVRHRK